MNGRVERMFGPREEWGKGNEMGRVKAQAAAGGCRHGHGKEVPSYSAEEYSGSGKGSEMTKAQARAVRQEGGGTEKGRRCEGRKGRGDPVMEKKAPSVSKADSSPVLRTGEPLGNGTGAVPCGKDGEKKSRGVKGFVSIKCPECGRVHNTCLHEERTIFNCKDCGQPVALEGLKSIRMDCPRCRFKARYLTNREEKEIQMECLNCSHPVNLRKGFRRGNYVPEVEA